MTSKLEQIDARIKEVESTLVYLLHERLALAKSECKHQYTPTESPFVDKCKLCGGCRDN